MLSSWCNNSRALPQKYQRREVECGTRTQIDAAVLNGISCKCGEAVLLHPRASFVQLWTEVFTLI